MKEIDDTPVSKSESEDEIRSQLTAQMVSLVEMNTEMNARILRLEKRVKAAELDRIDLDLRIANLETQRTPQDENDDPEWFS